MTTARRYRTDAIASIFVFGLAGVALISHVVTSVTDRWSGGELALDASGPHGPRTVVVRAADVPGWAATTLRGAEVVEWAASAAVLVMLTMCVLGMVRGDAFARSTARWAAWASGTVIGGMILVPIIARTLATNVALQSTPDPDQWSSRSTGPEFWYLYVGSMLLSFLALVLRRGRQLEQDQEGLI